MICHGSLRSTTHAATLVALFLFSAGVAILHGAPFSSATVTKVERIVDYGEVKGGRTVKRRATVSDTVRANNFLLTETESRAELQYEDGSVVRIGQNTVFSFDADTRTLTLEKGALIFHIPKGSGGGRVKTASLTAAITGTTGKVSEDTIAILEGEVRLIPSGRPVPAGSFARRLPGGEIVIREFDQSRSWEGRLMTFNGPMPGFREELPGTPFQFQLPAFNESLERTQNHPTAIERFFPIRRDEELRVPQPDHDSGSPVTPY